jgi:hypothetical protein
MTATGCGRQEAHRVCSAEADAGAGRENTETASLLAEDGALFDRPVVGWDGGESLALLQGN